MRSAYIEFLKQLLILSAILGALALLFFFIIPHNFFSPAIPFVLVFFMAATLISFRFLLRSAGKRVGAFINTFLLTIVVKLFLYAAILVIYSLLNRSDAVPFMISFFILYLCFTVFESASVVRITRAPGPGEGIR